MYQSSELTNTKTEPTNSTSSDPIVISTEMQKDSVQKKSDSLIETEIYVKMEPQEDENFPVIASTSYDMCIKNESDEQMIKVECESLGDESVQDSLNVGSEIKGTHYEKCPSDGFNVEANVPIKIEFKYLEINEIQDPPEVRSEIKGEEDSPMKLNSETSFITSEEIELNVTEIDDKPNESESNIDRNNKKHTCPVCHKIFTLKCSLNVHLRIHSGIKPFTCDICKKSFTRKHHLENHMLIHTGVKPYICDVCEKSFRNKKHLSDHKRIHTGTKPYSCNECDKSFTRKDTFVNHTRVHTKEKPFVCDLCYKAFARKSVLIQHTRIHTGEKPYSCDICNKSFARKSSLIYHRVSH